MQLETLPLKSLKILKTNPTHNATLIYGKEMLQLNPHLLFLEHHPLFKILCGILIVVPHITLLIARTISHPSIFILAQKILN